MPSRIINRPGVDGAVLQTALSLNNLLTKLLILFLLRNAIAPKVNIFTRALLPQKFLPKGLELVNGGSVINGATPLFFLQASKDLKVVKISLKNCGQIRQ